MAALAAYYLCDHSDTLVRGEKGLLLLVAQDKRAAKISLDYIQGCFEATQMLNQLVKERQRDELRLTNGIVIEVRAPSLRGVRGTTCIAVICDEIAFWRSDESVNPDQEILNALRPARATTNGPLIAISSPPTTSGTTSKHSHFMNVGIVLRPSADSGRLIVNEPIPPLYG
jgi:hypothetical protein